MTHMTNRHGAPPGLALLLAALAALALHSGCAKADRFKPLPAPTLIQAPGKPSVTVSQDRAGARIELERAQALVVRLPVRVSGGLEWSLVELKPGVLRPQGPTFERALRSTDADEAAGASVWHFVPEAAGSVALNFQLRRAHSTAPALQTVTYDVTVR